MLFPSPPILLRTKGTITHKPKKPYTTDGIPARRSTAGFIILYSFSGQNLARYTAVRIPIGTPIITAPAVMYILPIIIGKIPNTSLLGFHFCPKMKSKKPIFVMAGMPFAKRNMHINATDRIDTQAHSMNTTSITFSLT